MLDNYVLYSNIKEIDLHGMDRYSASLAINEFINDSYILKVKYLKIVHGKGTGVLRKTTLDTLKHNKNVLDYKLDIFNDGCTVVLLKDKK